MGIKGFMRRGAFAALATGAMVAGLVVSTPTTSGASTPTSATFAEQPSATPNFILPFYPGSLCSVANTDQFQYLMYRPLYWFGNGTSPQVDPTLSVANPPKYSSSGTTVTVSLKNWKWSNGETVTAQDVLFFMNIYHAEKANFCGYVPNLFPDNVTNVTASGQTATFTFNHSYNDTWILGNEFSQITPMPVAWDITAAGGAPGSGGCSSAAYGTADAACTKVYTFLSNAAGYNANNPNAANNSLSTYATNPLWQTVDGPWKLKSFNADGNVSFVPNPSYSGPVKATLKTFSEVPFTTDNAEFNALVAGNLSVGYLPTQDVTKGTNNSFTPGPNNPRLTSYTLDPLYDWGINYFVPNFSSNTGAVGKIWSQLYFRKAIQSLVDQPLYIKKLWKGYAVPIYGPVPIYPKNSFASRAEASNPYPYNPAAAKADLQDNGWKIVPNGVDTCIKPGTGAGECGAGIPAGTPLTIGMQVASGIQALTQQVTAEKASWASEGINMQISFASFDTVISSAVACPSGCSWQTVDWGGGWTFAPDTYPSGEDLFNLGAVADYGDYNDAKNAQLTAATDDSNVPLTTWENYLAKQLPDIWQPNPAVDLFEVTKSLSNAAITNPYVALTPEAWRAK